MTTIDKTKPVMITGATGYVAGWIVKQLLDEGLHVHAPVRDPGISPTATSESFNIFRQMGDGTMKMGAPPMEIGVFDR